MTFYRDLWQELCSYQNLELAFKKARKGKTFKPDVVEFEKNLNENISLLRTELLLHSYHPKPLQTFILRDPKTRKISKSDFRDRVVHHALCNIIEPHFEKSFIYDSYANRKGKGTLKALERCNEFKKKVSENYRKTVFVLKADIRHYFEEVDHAFLMEILRKKISDPRVLWLIKRILSNYKKTRGKGMPLGNLTSQFFANVYLNELDYFVKYLLKAKYYIRYVDDFVILHTSKEQLGLWKKKIDFFLLQKLLLELHPDKTRILPLSQGIEFLGYKIFSFHYLIKRKNIRKFYRTYALLSAGFAEGKIPYDSLYDFMEGWIAHAKNASAYKLRKKILQKFEEKFPHEISAKEVNRLLPQKRRIPLNSPPTYYNSQVLLLPNWL